MRMYICSYLSIISTTCSVVEQSLRYVMLSVAGWLAAVLYCAHMREECPVISVFCCFGAWI